MTTKLQILVTEAVSLDREISDQTERLKTYRLNRSWTFA